jgi:Na+/H+ antiporter NhaD/arsenite permease-like protein
MIGDSTAVDFFSYVLAVSALSWLSVLILYLTMRIFIAMRRRSLDRRIEALLARYEPMQVSAARRLPHEMRFHEDRPESPGDVILELDLTSEN